jgi:hypothetical protein
MSQKLNIALKGLKTNINQLQVGDGALVAVNNVNIDRGFAESRRGFNAYAAQTDIDRITEYQDHLIVHRTNDTMSYYTSGTKTDYSGTFAHPNANTARMRFLQANQNLYFTTSTGIKMLDVYNGSVLSTGMPKGLDGVGSTTGASGFMNTNTQVAYRVVWGAKDANNNLVLGAPSQIINVANTSGGTRDVSLTFTIPSGITTSDFFQVYRSRESASSSTAANDELQLVYEANPTAGEITAKSVTFTDSTATSLLGAALYTNANQEGIAQSNDIPPYATDMAFFKGYTFFSNTKTRYYLNVNLLSVGGSAGLVADDTITINGMVFTAKAATTVASRQFKVFTGGSAAQNIADTAKELALVVNQYTSNSTIYAYYLSGYDDLPGQLRFEERTLSSSAFTVSVSRATAWDIDDGTADNEEFQNGLAWSKDQQPEHVPAANLQLVGSKSYPIKRILALRDALYILKGDGAFKLTGSGGVWSIEQLDTVNLLSPDSAVVLNNQIYCLTNQGVVSISDVGVQVVSESIKDSLVELIGLDFTTYQNSSFGIAYETDRKYILFVSDVAGDEQPAIAYVFNVFTNEWSMWTKDAIHGFVAPSNDKLYLANDATFLEERKNYLYTDYVDEARSASYSIVSSTGTTVVLNTVSDIVAGDLLWQTSEIFSTITAVDSAASSITVNDTGLAWTAASATVYKAIDTSIEWAAQYCDNPGLEKVFQELAVIYKQKRFLSATLGFFTDVSGGWSDVSITGIDSGQDWGLFAWGGVPWGGEIRGSLNRIRVPRDKTRGQYLSIRFVCRNAYSTYQLQGLALQYDMTSERLKGE